MAGFANSVVGGMGKLIRESIHSPNYVPGVSGWTINKDGSAEFSDVAIRGTVQSANYSTPAYSPAGASLNVNPTFGSDTAGWFQFGGTLIRDNAHAYMSTWAGKFTATGGVQYTGFSSAPFTVTPGEVLYLSGAIWPTSHPVELKVDWYDADGIRIDQSTLGMFTDYGQWTFRSGLITAFPENVATGTITCIMAGFAPALAPFWGDALEVKRTTHTTGTGWKIDVDGTAEFNELVARGSMESSNYVPGSAGWHIDDNGFAEFGNARLRGSWEVTDGTQSLRGYLTTAAVNPFDPTPVPTPTLALNPDLAGYDDGFIYPRPIASDNVSQLVFGAPRSNVFGGTRATMSLFQNYQDDFFGLEVPGYLYTGRVHETTAQMDDMTAAGPFMAPGGVYIAATVVVDITDVSPYSPVIVWVCWHGITLNAPSGTIGNNRVSMQITENGSQVQAQRLILQNTTQTQAGGSFFYVGPPPPSPGTYTYQLRLVHEGASSAGGASLNASATSPARIAVKGF